MQDTGLVAALQAENARLSTQVAHLEAVNSDLQRKFEKLIQQLRGKRSERLNPAELFEVCLPFFSEEELALFQEPAPEPTAPPRPPGTKRAPRPRKLITAEMPREEVLVPLSQDEKTCVHCDVSMPCIGYDIVEKLNYRPAQFFVKRYLMEKCACGCGLGIASAKLPPQLVPNGKAEAALLAYIMVAKFQDHLPFYRQSKIYARSGAEIPDTTLVEWSNQVADALEAIVFLMKRQLLKSGYIQADETGLRVLVKGKGVCHPGYLWVYGNPGSQIVFDFRMTRERDGPMDFLDGFHGLLQSDAYQGYDELKKSSSILWFACWAHARRYFKDAQENAKAPASKILKFIQSLYVIEEEARSQGLSADQRQQLRQSKARPILNALEQYLHVLQLDVLPKSDIGKAVSYCLRRWDSLTRYVDHGEVEIDNNLCENSLRGVGLGRKNYLFAGSEAGGRKAAVIYSIVETCKRLKIDAYQYLVDVLTRLPSTPVERLEELTPVAWKQLRERDSSAA